MSPEQQRIAIVEEAWMALGEAFYLAGQDYDGKSLDTCECDLHLQLKRAIDALVDTNPTAMMVALMLRVAAAEVVSADDDECPCGCQGHCTLQRALAAWREANK